MVTGPVHLCVISTPEHTVLQPLWGIEHIAHLAISVLPDAILHLSQVKHVKGKCLTKETQTLTRCLNVERGERNIAFI